MFTCFQCGAEYLTRKRLMRHVRLKHPSKIIKCQYCGYVLSSSLKYQMKRHMELRHSAQVKTETNLANEITIPATPFLGLEHYEPTNNYEPVNQKPEGFTKTKTKNSRTETVSVPPKTPEKSVDISFSNMSSPASIILGIDDHPNVSPIKTDLLGLFSVPTQISPLKSTPKKRKWNDAETEIETFVVIEDPTLNSGSRSEPCFKRDSSHLVLPNVTTVQEGKIHNRFLAPPSSYQTTNDAAIVRYIRSKAIRSENYKGSVIPYGYAGVKKEEKVVFPDGTVYYLSAFWMADPQLSTNMTVETQTPLMMLPSRMVTSSMNTDQLDVRDAHTTESTTRTIETQTDDREEINSIEEDFSYFS